MKMPIDDFDAELVQLAQRLQLLTPADREQLGERAVFGLELLVSRGRAVAHRVAMERFTTEEMDHLLRVLKVAKALLARLG
jgi:hypothetical protein